MLIFLQSCGFNMDTDKYSFDNFKSTPIWNLAKAVRADNTDLIMEILEDDRIASMIDLKDPKYNQTLLSLAIQDKKNKAFITLLKKVLTLINCWGKKWMQHHSLMQFGILRIVIYFMWKQCLNMELIRT